MDTSADDVTNIKHSTVSCDDQYLSMRNMYNDDVVYMELQVSAKDCADNNPKYRSQSAAKVPYSSQRQSAQMETFVDNFIKPKLTTENLTSTVPNAKLTNELMKRVSKKRTNFNLIILGEQGLGKRTFIESLIKNKVSVDEKEEVKVLEDINSTDDNKIVERPCVLLRDGQKIYLNIIEVPGFGMELNCDKELEDILKYVDGSFEESFRLECSLDRRTTEDRKIHCCLYFISPFGHSLKPLDIVFLKQFQSKINIIPVIAKCDVFTKDELRRFKANVLSDFIKHKIDLFEYLNNSEPIDDEMDDIKEICEEIKNNIPFAISSSMDFIKSRNNNEYGRQYPWGTVKTENSEISDFRKLENILTKTHINYFKKLTKTVHYENFRMKYILERVK